MSIGAIGIAFISAMFYVLATLIMKLHGASAFYLALPVACLSLIAAAAFEIEVLKDGHMGRVFILILGFEIVATLACSVLIAGETVSVRDLVGVALLAAGIVVISGGHEDKAPTHKGSAIAAAKQENLIADAGSAGKTVRLARLN